MPEGLTERVKKLRNRSARTIEELDRTEQGSGKKPTKPSKPSEKRGVGEPDSASVNEARIKMLRRKLEAIKDPDVRKRLQDQIKALQSK